MQTPWNKIGLHPKELPRVKLAWWIRFWYQFGLISAWTISTALFIEHFGIENFALFFWIESLVLIVSTVFASFIFHRVKSSSFIQGMIVLTLLLLVVGWLYGVVTGTMNLVFFVLLLIAKDGTFSQLNIALYRRSEENFSPSEAVRIMPVIESAITFGNLLGSLALVIALTYLEPQQTLLIWAFALVVIGGLITFAPQILHSVPLLVRSEKKIPTHVPLIQEGWAGIKEVKFLRKMAVVMLLQMVIFTVIEYEFTKEIHDTIAEHTHEKVIALEGDALQTSLLRDVTHSVHTLVKETASTAHESVAEISGTFITHQRLAHDLGMFHLLFSAFAIVIQLFCTAPILKRLGIIRTMSVYIGILFGGISAIILSPLGIKSLQSLQHGFHSLGETSYHMSFYSLFHQRRESIRLYLEGIIKPLGVMIAVGGVLFIPHGFWLPMIAILAAIALVVTLIMRKDYSHISYTNLRHEQNQDARLHALEILGQRGHDEATEVLLMHLNSKTNHPILRQKIIAVLTERNDPVIVPAYMQFLRDETEPQELKIHLLDSLLKMQSLRSYWHENVFSRHYCLETLQNLFDNDPHPHMKKLIVMNMFKHMPSQDVVPFFTATTKDADPKLLSIYLRSSRMFSDPAIEHYLRPYLDNDDPRIQSHAVIALWNYAPHDILRQKLIDLLVTEEKESLIAAIYAIGEIRDPKLHPWLKRFIKDEDNWIRLHALIALAKFGDDRCKEELMKMLLGQDIALAQAAYHMLDRTEEHLREDIRCELRSQVARRVHVILTEQHITTPEDINRQDSSFLSYLKHLYLLADRYDHILVLEGLG